MMWLRLVFDLLTATGPALLADAVKHASSDHCGMHFLVSKVYGFHPLRVVGC